MNSYFFQLVKGNGSKNSTFLTVLQFPPQPSRGRERPSAARRSGRQTGSRVNGLVWFWFGSAGLVLATSAAVSEAAKPGGPFPRSVVGNPEFSPKVRGYVCSFCWISFSLAFFTLFGFFLHYKTTVVKQPFTTPPAESGEDATGQGHVFSLPGTASPGLRGSQRQGGTWWAVQCLSTLIAEALGWGGGGSTRGACLPALLPCFQFHHIRDRRGWKAENNQGSRLPRRLQQPVQTSREMNAETHTYLKSILFDISVFSPFMGIPSTDIQSHVDLMCMFSCVWTYAYA